MGAVSVTTTATRLDTAAESDDGDRKSAVSVYNNGAATVYLEVTRSAAAVTTANGYPLAAGQHFAVDLDKAEALYGRVASGTVEVRVVEAGI